MTCAGAASLFSSASESDCACSSAFAFSSEGRGCCGGFGLENTPAMLGGGSSPLSSSPISSQNASASGDLFLCCFCPRWSTRVTVAFVELDEHLGFHRGV